MWMRRYGVALGCLLLSSNLSVGAAWGQIICCKEPQSPLGPKERGITPAIEFRGTKTKEPESPREETAKPSDKPPPRKEEEGEKRKGGK